LIYRTAAAVIVDGGFFRRFWLAVGMPEQGMSSEYAYAITISDLKKPLAYMKVI
jgi:hypothetical protein